VSTSWRSPSDVLARSCRCSSDRSKDKRLTWGGPITKKTASSTFDERIAKLKEIHRGWINYFRMGNMQSKLKELDSWLRNRLRYCIWEDWKS
ncbi:MAG: group II intron maturase-specific domain-containing protein, partial [Bacteroidota bacterium]|nr:group II intron maturase-specific domain-containing protein [bacterium]MDZ4809507.1 group II intron maturase-specific domain-containing protein [Bacteroidota bacterium]